MSISRGRCRKEQVLQATALSHTVGSRYNRLPCKGSRVTSEKISGQVQSVPLSSPSDRSDPWMSPKRSLIMQVDCIMLQRKTHLGRGVFQFGSKPVILQVEHGDLNRVVAATGAQIQTTVNNLDPKALGSCAEFEERQVRPCKRSSHSFLGSKANFQKTEH